MMSFASFRVANNHFALANNHFCEAKQPFPLRGTVHSPPRKNRIPIRGCRAAETVDLTEPFEPDTGNTGEGSLRSTDYYRGCRTFTAEDVRRFFFGKIDHFFKKSEKIG